MNERDWQAHPDEGEPTIFWVRWRGKMTTNRWHATIDGNRTLCHLSIWKRLYVGRQFERCSHCLRAVERLNAPEPG